jgi:hypothetical protein
MNKTNPVSTNPDFSVIPTPVTAISQLPVEHLGVGTCAVLLFGAVLVCMVKERVQSLLTFFGRFGEHFALDERHLEEKPGSAQTAQPDVRPS